VFEPADRDAPTGLSDLPPGILNSDGAVPALRVFRSLLYPVPQNAPRVTAGMNLDPTSPSENDALPIQHGWIGVNVLNFPQGQLPKATDVSPWYGV